MLQMSAVKIFWYENLLDKVDKSCFGRRMTEQNKNEGRDSLEVLILFSNKQSSMMWTIQISCFDWFND